MGRNEREGGTEPITSGVMYRFCPCVFQGFRSRGMAGTFVWGVTPVVGT